MRKYEKENKESIENAVINVVRSQKPTSLQIKKLREGKEREEESETYGMGGVGKTNFVFATFVMVLNQNKEQ